MYNVNAYNKISRIVEIKTLTCFGVDGKQDCLADLNKLKQNSPDAFFKLLSKLVAIKYYRQTGFLGCFGTNVEDKVRQNQLWEELRDQIGIDATDPGVTRLVNSAGSTNTYFRLLMVFIKNDGLLVQRKIPSELKSLLALSDADKDRLINHFDPNEKTIMCHFLSDATGEDWSKKDETSQLLGNPSSKGSSRPSSSPQTLTKIGNPPKTIHPPNNSISLVIRSQEIAKQTGNNYNSAALSTVALFNKRAIPDSLKNTNEYESDIELITRTSDGLVSIAQQIGLTNAAAVKLRSADDYRACIQNSLDQNKPLIAPFIMDSGRELQLCRSYGYVLGINYGVRGKPITQQTTVTEMGKPIKDLVDESTTIEKFKISVNDLAAIGDNGSVPAEMIHNPTNLTGSKKQEQIMKPIREKQMAVEHFHSLITGMTNDTFQAIKDGTIDINDFIIHGELMHSCVITGYNPDTDDVTIAHWNRTYTTTAEHLYASSQLLPEQLNGVLYTFVPERSTNPDSIYS